MIGGISVLEKGHIFTYGSTGVCSVEDITLKDFGAGKKEYYILAPVYDARSTLCVPVDSPVFASHAQELLTKEETLEIIDSFGEEPKPWILNDKERAEAFKTTLESGDRREIARLICTLYSRKVELAGKNRKLRSSDETVMQRAQKVLFGEFAYVLGIEPQKVPDFIKERIE